MEDISLANAHATLNSFRYGLGIGKRIYNNFSMRLEYSYIHYHNHSEIVLDPADLVTKTTYVSPRTNQFELAFVYNFS